MENFCIKRVICRQAEVWEKGFSTFPTALYFSSVPQKQQGFNKCFNLFLLRGFSREVLIWLSDSSLHPSFFAVFCSLNLLLKFTYPSHSSKPSHATPTLSSDASSLSSGKLVGLTSPLSIFPSLLTDVQRHHLLDTVFTTRLMFLLRKFSQIEFRKSLIEFILYKFW